ncbi:SDR family NAD(P)-dependent oxidoreductase [Roseobacter sinensis]|uniref:SDR family oxidoreductase n=1 Tax=Roseobacter sinensis TaxID=2931391 RepID=A0ABT3B9C8_9RHOB|nr:SDR family oxidoreductase [Roseobacter sp. WL0113]MCV3270184.1 SDR family oxidoreductase [Roseobacter sp. WL0113]
MFENKTVIVTGGASGIGKEVAARFAQAGSNVVINGRDAVKLDRVAAEIGARAVAGDIADVSTAVRIVAQAEAAFGGVDILINNAGIFAPKPFLDQTEAEYDAFVDTILKGKFFMAQAAARSMIRRGGGAIVQTGSMWALQAIGATPSAAYSAANAGVHQMVRNLALELADHSIRINAVAPAVVETPVYSTFMSEEEVAATLPGFNAFHPLGRNGQPGDVADAILFLASDKAAWITGTVLPVDGGVMAGRN